MNTQGNIRNFCIIAHIDHGKSTLADRLLELTGTIDKKAMREQVLDSNPIERERGITIKLAPVRMVYKMQKSKIKNQNDKEIFNFDIYTLNLIDTPGHVDFSYEVSRTLAACEGAILVVDATVGVQAQTLSNLELARKHNLVIIPVINKIDLPNARIEHTIEEVTSLEFGKNEILTVSAKTGENVPLLLEEIVNRIPPPSGKDEEPLRALVFSSGYDSHKGVVVFVRVVDGIVSREKIRFMASGIETTPVEIGYFSPAMKKTDQLATGEVGYIATGLKDTHQAKVGDTVTNNNFELRTKNLEPFDKTQGKQKKVLGSRFNVIPLSGYQEPKPMVFLDLYPIDTGQYLSFRESIEKLRLADSAFSRSPINSAALGNGFHCGFLGLLHAEIVQERLFREFGLSLIATVPTVEYKIKIKNQKSKIKIDELELLSLQSPSDFPDPSLIEQSLEPVMEVTVISPKQFVGAIMQLVQGKRGELIDLKYHLDQANFTYLIPFSEMIFDFFDRVKSITEGYASVDYKFLDYQEVELVKLDILLNAQKVDALSILTVKEKAESFGRRMVEKLKEVIPQQQFAIPIQAAVGGKIIAREDVSAFRKDVTKKLYGGDRTRKDKLLEAQKKGKKRLKMFGRVAIPQEAFLKVFKWS